MKIDPPDWFTSGMSPVKVDKNQKYRFKWRSTDLNEGLLALMFAVKAPQQQQRRRGKRQGSGIMPAQHRRERVWITAVQTATRQMAHMMKRKTLKTW